jgi:hypothetical protein
VNCVLVLQVVDDDRYIFVSSLLGLLAEYGIRPHVVNASAISNSVKVTNYMDYISARSEHGTARQCMNFEAALIYVFISH